IASMLTFNQTLCSIFTCHSVRQAPAFLHVPNCVPPLHCPQSARPGFLIPHPSPPDQYPRALATGYVSNLGSFFSLREWRVFRHESIRRASLVVDLPVSLYINGLGASFLSSRGKHCHPRRCRYAAHSWRRPAALW